MNILNLSGGGTKIAGINAAAQNLITRGFTPDIITGVSAGSYLALPLALGYFEAANNLINSLTLDKMFDPKPVNEKGKLTLGAIMRMTVGGKYWIGDQRKSLDIIRTIINSDDFHKWRLSTFKNGIKCLVSAVDFRSGSKVLIDLSRCSYENALDFILASGSIPFFTKGVNITYDAALDISDLETGMRKQLLFDGGLRNHIASVVTIKTLLRTKRIDNCISIYARPENYRIDESQNWMPSDASTTVQRTLDIMGIEISKKDEEMEVLLCDAHNIKLNQIFLPNVMRDTYDVDKTRMSEYIALSVIEAMKVQL